MLSFPGTLTTASDIKYRTLLYDNLSSDYNIASLTTIERACMQKDLQERFEEIAAQSGSLLDFIQIEFSYSSNPYACLLIQTIIPDLVTLALTLEDGIEEDFVDYNDTPVVNEGQTHVGEMIKTAQQLFLDSIADTKVKNRNVFNVGNICAIVFRGISNYVKKFVSKYFVDEYGKMHKYSDTLVNLLSLHKYFIGYYHVEISQSAFVTWDQFPKLLTIGNGSQSSESILESVDTKDLDALVAITIDGHKRMLKPDVNEFDFEVWDMEMKETQRFVERIQTIIERKRARMTQETIFGHVSIDEATMGEGSQESATRIIESLERRIQSDGLPNNGSFDMTDQLSNRVLLGNYEKIHAAIGIPDISVELNHDNLANIIREHSRLLKTEAHQGVRENRISSATRNMLHEHRNYVNYTSGEKRRRQFLHSSPLTDFTISKDNQTDDIDVGLQTFLRISASLPTRASSIESLLADNNKFYDSDYGRNIAEWRGTAHYTLWRCMGCVYAIIKGRSVTRDISNVLYDVGTNSKVERKIDDSILMKWISGLQYRIQQKVYETIDSHNKSLCNILFRDDHGMTPHVDVTGDDTVPTPVQSDSFFYRRYLNEIDRTDNRDTKTFAKSGKYHQNEIPPPYTYYGPMVKFDTIFLNMYLFQLYRDQIFIEKAVSDPAPGNQLRLNQQAIEYTIHHLMNIVHFKSYLPSKLHPKDTIQSLVNMIVSSMHDDKFFHISFSTTKDASLILRETTAWRGARLFAMDMYGRLLLDSRGWAKQMRSLFTKAKLATPLPSVSIRQSFLHIQMILWEEEIVTQNRQSDRYAVSFERILFPDDNPFPASYGVEDRMDSLLNVIFAPPDVWVEHYYRLTRLPIGNSDISVLERIQSELIDQEDQEWYFNGFWGNFSFIKSDIR